jgi:hypothetical protein
MKRRNDKEVTFCTFSGAVNGDVLQEIGEMEHP